MRSVITELVNLIIIKQAMDGIVDSRTKELNWRFQVVNNKYYAKWQRFEFQLHKKDIVKFTNFAYDKGISPWKWDQQCNTCFKALFACFKSCYVYTASSIYVCCHSILILKT